MKKLLLLSLFFVSCLNCMEQGNENQDEKEDKTPLLPHRDSHDIESAQKLCPICLTELTGDIKTLPCRHQFHTQCIGQWEYRFEKEFRCPLCRHHIYRIFPGAVFPAQHEAPPFHHEEDEEVREENRGNGARFSICNRPIPCEEIVVPICGTTCIFCVTLPCWIWFFI